MIFEMYKNSGIYRLDDEYGKGRIYEIINKSISKSVEKLFSKPAVVDVPDGKYDFYIDEYNLELMYYLDQIYNFLELIEDTVSDKVSHLQTINNDGVCHYVATIPQKEDNIRFLIIDRKEENCRDISTRYKDSELKSTAVVADVIIKRDSFIQQCYEELNRIYEENKYYISKEYEEKCEKEGAILYQEYVLKNICETVQFLNKYLKNFNVRYCRRLEL